MLLCWYPFAPAAQIASHADVGLPLTVLCPPSDAEVHATSASEGSENNEDSDAAFAAERWARVRCVPMLAGAFISACALQTGWLSPALSSPCKTPLQPGSLPAEAWLDLPRAAVTRSPQMRGLPSKIARRCAHAACESAQPLSGCRGASWHIVLPVHSLL